MNRVSAFIAAVHDTLPKEIANVAGVEAREVTVQAKYEINPTEGERVVVRSLVKGQLKEHYIPADTLEFNAPAAIGFVVDITESWKPKPKRPTAGSGAHLQKRGPQFMRPVYRTGVMLLT
jgi:hypothetical protein